MKGLLSGAFNIGVCQDLHVLAEGTGVRDVCKVHAGGDCSMQGPLIEVPGSS